MKLKTINIIDIIPYKNNPRINDEAIDKVAESIKQFGYKQPIVIDKDNIVIVGHTRLEALKKIGFTSINVLIADDLDEEKVKAYRLADNKTNEFSYWDIEKLSLELNELDNINMTDFGFDEFETLEIENNEVKEDNFDAEEEIKNINSTITKKNDIWIIGKHKLMCGDYTNKEDVNKLIVDKKIDCLITDPPYGVDYCSKNEMLNKFEKGNRNQTPIINDKIENYKDFFKSFLELIPFNDYNTFYIAMSGQELHNLRLAIEESGMKWGDYLIWVKNNHVLGRKDYNAKHEFFVYGWKGKHKFYGGFSTTILEYNKNLKNDLHPTMKPINLISRLIKDGSQKNSIIYDAFGGSGTTLISCEQTERICYMIEIDEKYCDVIVKRYIDLKGNNEDVFLIRNNEKIKFSDI